MPFADIPTAIINMYGAGSFPLAPAQGETVSAQWPLVINYPPQPGERFNLVSFNLPVTLTANNTAGTLPTVAFLTPKLFLSGLVAIQVPVTVNLTPLAASPGWVAGNGMATASLQTPIAYRAGQTLALGFDIQLDQATTTLNVVLAGILQNPATSGIATPSPGSIGYLSASDDLTVVA